MRATFLTIERPLVPEPPRDAKPYWCLINRLVFHDESGATVWDQEIPEAQLYWLPNYRWGGDEFDKYFHCEVFLDEHHGWQLRASISHEKAKQWHKDILEWMQFYHNQHHAKKERKTDVRRLDDELHCYL